MKLFPITIPGGSDTHVQYNNGGIFGGDSTFTFNDSTKVVDMDGLTITGTIATGLDMSGGTFATASINLPTTPVIQQNGAHLIKFDDVNFNVLMGTETGQGVPDEGEKNVFIGYHAGRYNDTTGGASEGRVNVYIGFETGLGSAGTPNIGYSNIAIGSEAMEDNQTGFNCVAIGQRSLANQTDGNNNFALGTQSLLSLLTGTSNVAIGGGTLAAITTGGSNLALGTNAGTNIPTSSQNNVFIGQDAGKGAVTANTTLNSVFIGRECGKVINGANFNVCIGHNTAIALSSGDQNTMIGYSAGLAQTTASFNTYIGWKAGFRNVTGTGLTIVGHEAGGENGGGGSFSRSTIFGYQAGWNVTTADDCLYIGYHAGVNQTTLDDIFILDNQDRGSVAAEITDCLMYGVFNSTVASQTLRFNAGTVSFGAGVDNDLIINFIGTTNSGVLKWMEDEDYFEFGDDIFVGSEEVSGDKFKITSIGGFAVKLTNQTGANTVQGQLVKADTASDDAVILTAAGDDECFGVFLESGVADGSETWVVVAGIADVAMEDNTAATHGNWVETSDAEAGYADATSATPAAAPAHFEEIGHCIESVAAGGGGTHILARCILHFN